MKKKNLLLVNMPFSSIQFPSIQAGLLKAIACEAGMELNVNYANVRLARELGVKVYDYFVHHRGPMISEWMFASSAFGGRVPPGELFMDAFQKDFEIAEATTGLSVSELLRIRNSVIPKFVDSLAAEIVGEGANVVCFTSTFQQNVSSLALARALKRCDATITTVFGGANFDGQMGAAYVKAFPEIDIAVIGEADGIFAELLRRLSAGEAVSGLAGVLVQGESIGAERLTFSGDMDRLPIPDYSDYFSALKRYKITSEEIGRPICLLFEGSRGCWWGEKHHCKFCGLNGNGMNYRRKSANRMVDEICTLTSRHRMARINAVDNILDHKQMKKFCDLLSEGEYDFELFYEVKANLTRRDIQTLADAGMREVQPGIESLSTRVLGLMDKGITALQNINAIRWFCYYGIFPHWNLLYGFPGEVDSDFHDQARIIPMLAHLPPPKGLGEIWLERFSPYFKFNDNAKRFSDVRPHDSYKFVYPTCLDLNEAAYFFQGTLLDPAGSEAVSALRDSVRLWMETWEKDALPFLVMQKFQSGIRVVDGRKCSPEPDYIFYTGLAASVLGACMDLPASKASIARKCSLDSQSQAEMQRLELALAPLLRRGIVIEDGGKYLALPLPLKRGRAARGSVSLDLLDTRLKVLSAEQ